MTERRYRWGVKPSWVSKSPGGGGISSQFRFLDFGQGRKKALAEKFLEAVEEEGDIDEVFERYVNIGTHQPGTERKKVETYLKRELEKAISEGRL